MRIPNLRQKPAGVEAELLAAALPGGGAMLDPDLGLKMDGGSLITQITLTTSLKKLKMPKLPGGD